MARTLIVLFALVFAFATVSAYVAQPRYGAYPYERNYDYTYDYGFFRKPYNYRGHYANCRGAGCGDHPLHGAVESTRSCGYNWSGQYECRDY
ncbi:hypothetical protein QR680_007037 [Steinernema hermaphroditum]|uniref:Uncharacterized protein n=1 Tax=Steinernema hermaphroditum TaxID=289476 RepID=A0AA39HZX2_9BILA|nr:hypothetical protein QR680_007037 [Steinernema hermaphroditum]